MVIEAYTSDDEQIYLYRTTFKELKDAMNWREAALYSFRDVYLHVKGDICTNNLIPTTSPNSLMIEP